MLRPMGSTAKPMNTATTSTSGARKCTAASALSGTISSLVSDLIPSATGCRIPSQPTRLGPIRFCMRASPLRSKTVVSANSAGNKHDDRHHAQHNTCRRPPRAGQKAHQPLFEQNEDLVQSFRHRLVSVSSRTSRNLRALHGRGNGRRGRLCFSLGLALRQHERPQPEPLLDESGGNTRSTWPAAHGRRATRQSGPLCSAQTRCPS